MSRFIVCLFVFTLSASAHAGLIDSAVNYLKQYRLGAELSTYDSSLNLKYLANSSEAQAPSCYQSGRSVNQKICTAAIGDDSNRGMDYGLFLQQRFLRRGLFHYDFDLGFSLRYLTGDNKKEQQAEQFPHPFSAVSYQYLLTEFRPYIQLGITPEKYWPDLIFSLGPVAHWAYGSMTIDGEEFRTEGLGVLGRSGVWEYTNYFETELVLWRFGQDGALSIFSATVVNRPTVGTGRLIPKRAGSNDIVGGDFRRHSSGIKWVIGKL